MQTREEEVLTAARDLYTKILHSSQEEAVDHISQLGDEMMQDILSCKFGRQQETILHLCAKKSLNIVMSELLKCNVDLKIKDVDGNSPLLSAAHSENHDGVALLAGKGFSARGVNKFGKTALHLAVLERCDSEMIDLLSHLGSDVNAVDSDGNTALHHALFGDGKALVPHLLAIGADPAIKNRAGVDSLYLASLRNDCDSVIALLASNRVDAATIVSQYSKSTILSEIAFDQRYNASLELLLAHGFNKAFSKRQSIINARGYESGHNECFMEFRDNLHLAWNSAQRGGNDVGKILIEQKARELRKSYKSLRLWDFRNIAVEAPKTAPQGAAIDDDFNRAKVASCVVM